MSEAVPPRNPAVERLLDELSALDRAYSAGHHGRWSARRRADLVDACLRDLFTLAGAPPGVGLVAVGGYGRKELVPASDIDLLILHGGERGDEVAALAQDLLYPLWDAGLAVGHAVRTGAECLEAAAARLDTTTALLDGRPLVGDMDLWSTAHAELLGWVRRDPPRFAEQLREDAARRRERFGSVSHLLEPDLKEGSGGLRDVHALGWLGAVLGEQRGSPTLDGVGLVRSTELEAVDAAEEFLVRVRSALHLETGRKSDRLFLDQQPSVARAMGFADEPGLRAVDALMRALFEHARQVEHVSSSVFDRYLRGESEPADFAETPEGVIGVFARTARQRGVLAPSVLDRIEAAEMPAEVEWTDGVRDAFLEILRAGPDGVRALETMDRIGLLERYVPEWGPVRCRPQRDPYHRYTVDIHLLETLSGIGRLLSGEEPTDPVTAQAVQTSGDRDAVLLGALLHDIGKNGAGNHVPEGTRVAASALERMRLTASTRGLAHFLVSEHLLLSDTATRRDLADDDLILDVAARVGDPERLAALYLLTVADAGATGPHAWTPWRQTLIRELITKVQRILERGEMGPEAAERMAERANEVRAQLGAEDPADVERFLVRMPRGYLAVVHPERAARHFGLVMPPVGALEVRTVVEPGARPSTHALTVVAADRPGLLSWIAGALSLAGLSILTAQVFTTEDGVALDVFEVEGWFEPEVTEERWREFRSSLRKAIEGRVSLDFRVAEKRKRYPPPRTDIPVEIAVDNEASDFFTVIEVGAPDRIGLLFDITRTMADLRLDVHLAKVATYGERVIDAFYVRDVVGRKVEDPEQVSEIDRALTARVAG